ncbi:GGDEF domain-containing protein [Erythrobacter sp. 3-20A1M]|uniref:GGDEF domain-containing protein n=1 Tax=Erythrobacter sp. 3-20A1M TaxID=2653850 RepID=UPI001BFC7261|nr:GGDEF domain-containing protein [Erythrobacter sp. 3-20A1M]
MSETNPSVFPVRRGYSLAACAVRRKSMQILVDLHLVVFCLLSALAAICAIAHVALKAGSALAWLAATLLCVGMETLVFRYAPPTIPGLAAISLLIPFAYFCAGNAIRQSLHLESAGRAQSWIFGGLVGLSLLLLAAGAPVFYQCIPFQLAGVYILYDAIRIQARRQRRGLIDNGLLALSAGSLIGLAIRAPMFPLLVGEPTPFPVMDAATFEGVFLDALGGLTAALAVLVIARIVASVIGVHKHRAEHDHLTGLLNRRTFDERAREAAAAAGSVVMCDIDRFKAVNDLYGHHVGDDVLQGFARILSRSGGIVGRMGGEEFGILLIDTAPDDAVVIADMIRTEFHRFRHDAIGEQTALSASFGVSDFGQGRSVKTALREADKALYRAKGAGRNRVCQEHSTSSTAVSFMKVA